MSKQPPTPSRDGGQGHYDIWKANLGRATQAITFADCNRDGIVDAANYTFWRHSGQLVPPLRRWQWQWHHRCPQLLDLGCRQPKTCSN
jgi:hypothetical protein